MKKQQTQRYWQKGVGLIELAIALVVIGILMGAVLQGKHLIDQARLNAIITDVHNIRLKAQQFKQTYGFWPGDFPFASRDLHASSPNGDGSGILNGNPFITESSAGRFWVHLNAAQGEIMNVGSPLTFGHGLPECAFGGGYTIVSNPIASMPGLWLVLGARDSDTGEGALLTPEHAVYINKKLGHGSPSTGPVRSLDASRNQSLAKCVVDDRYNLQTKDKACVMYFKLDE